MHIQLCLSFLSLNILCAERHIFEHNFITEMKKDTIIERLFDFSLMKSRKNNLMKVYIIDSGENFQIIKFEYNYLFFKTNATYRREKNKDTIKFFLLEYNGNNKIFPDIIAETGFYEIKDTISKSLVHYYQKTVFENKPDYFYINLYKNGMKNFYKELEKILR